MSKESTEKTPPSAVAPKPTHAESATPHNTPGGAAGNNGAAIASLILGIFAFLFGWFFLGFLLGAGAIVFGIIGLKKPGGKGMSIAGIITGAIGALSALLFSLIWLVAIFAGGAAVSEGVQEINQSQQEAANAQTEFSAGETARFGDFDVKITDVERNFIPENEFIRADEGNEFVALNLEVTNVTEEAEYIGSFEFELVANGVGKTPTFSDKTPSFESGSLQPGATTTGYVVYEIPEGASDLKLQYEGYTLLGGTVTYSLAVQE